MGTHTTISPRPTATWRRYRTPAAAIGVIGLTLAALTVTLPSAHAATAVNLGNAQSFAVLGGSTVTNTGPTILNGDLGVAPGTEITGFPPGLVQGGTIHANDAVAQQAKADLSNAYDVAAGQPSDFDIVGDLGGQTLVAGAYSAATSAGLTGALTLDGQNDPDAVWVFQIGSTLTTASNSSVTLINQAQACNVFWQVGSSATLGTTTDFIGTIMARTSITLNTGTTVEGRALAIDGAVTLDSNIFSLPGCETVDPGVDADVAADADADGTADADATDADGNVDADTDADGSVDGSTDTDAGTDADGNADATDTDATDAGTDANTDTDGNADAAGTDADGNADADSDADADTDAGASAADGAFDIDANDGYVRTTPVSGTLPATGGMNALWLAPLGALILATGAVLVLIQRRRFAR